MNQKKLVKKANKLIESRCNLTLNQQKLILAVVSMIDREDEDFKEYRLSISEFKKLMGLKSTGGYTEIRNEARAIKRKDLVIPLDDEGELITSWFSDVEIRYKGEIGFFVSAKLKPYLIQLKKSFTAYQLKNILKLSSKYSIRIYELTKQFENIGCRRFDLDELKRLLFIDSDKYTRYGDFRKRILAPSIQDINAHTDIFIECSTHKTGKAVTAVEFCIHKQTKQEESCKPEDAGPHASIIALIPEEHRKSCRDLCQQIFIQDGAEGLKFYIEKTNNRKQVKNGSYSGYLRTLFDAGVYQDMREVLKAQEKAKFEAERAKQKALALEKEKRQKHEAEQAKLKRDQELLFDIEENDPDRWAELERQAADNLNIKNPKRPGPGGKMKIRFEILCILDSN
jgi:hypothetical protein